MARAAHCKGRREVLSWPRAGECPRPRTALRRAAWRCDCCPPRGDCSYIWATSRRRHGRAKRFFWPRKRGTTLRVTKELQGVLRADRHALNREIHAIQASASFRANYGITSRRECVSHLLLMDSPKIERALVSVSDKTGLTEFAQGLVAAGVEIYASGGTRRHLEAGRHRRPRGGRLHRLPRDDGRPDQDAPPKNPRRHPLPPRQPGRHGRDRRAGHRAVRAGRGEPVSVQARRSPAKA